MPTDDDADLMLEAMRGVVPLTDRERAVVKPATEKRPAPSTGVQLSVDGDEGRAHGVNDEQLAKLRSGGFGVAHTVDLHRARADAAKQIVARQLAEAAVNGARCVLIVHGKGLHSASAPILRQVVIDTLSRGACAKLVLAFCPALAKHGGRGAMYVLLRVR